MSSPRVRGGVGVFIVRTQCVLIVDDSEAERRFLRELLKDECEVLEAENGIEAISLLRRGVPVINLVLLDTVMPEVDGFGVLEMMQNESLCDDIPVVLIDEEDSTVERERAYDLGVVDDISRPFQPDRVRRRVTTLLRMYARQRRLLQIATDQVYEKERYSDLMVNILGHIVEFRNSESGLHVLHIRIMTELLLRRIAQLTRRYRLTEQQITIISTAAALHDIGKIAIDEKILNKPGRLTPEEFRVIKTHTVKGADMLAQLPAFREEPLVKAAYAICRWHHERYDGAGYPDGLMGEQIPISAQVVAMADVYDALISKRCYKDAVSHQEAMRMIAQGECGAFSPLLQKALADCGEEIFQRIYEGTSVPGEAQGLRQLREELKQHEELSASEQTLSLLKEAREENRFFSALNPQIRFEFTMNPPVLTFTPRSAMRLGLKSEVVNPFTSLELRRIISFEELKRLNAAFRTTSPSHPIVSLAARIQLDGQEQEVWLACRVRWSDGRDPVYQGAAGQTLPPESVPTR